MDISEITKWIKLSPKYLLPIAFLSFALLFLPISVLARLGVDVLVQNYRMWIGLIGLGTACLLMSHLVFWLKDFLVEAVRKRRLLKACKEYLRHLTPEEKTVLVAYIISQTRSQNLDSMSGVVNGLEQAKIIYRSASIGTLMGGWAYNLQPWAWDELNAYPELLEPELSRRRTELLQERERHRY